MKVEEKETSEEVKAGLVLGLTVLDGFVYELFRFHHFVKLDLLVNVIAIQRISVTSYD